MKAFIVDTYGKGQPLRQTELPVPEVGEHDVLVRILASGVNPLDAKIRDGEFKIPLPYKTPFVLGNDLAGVVEAVGSAVRDFAVGMEVYARPDKDRIGTFAEYLSVGQDDLALKPDNLTMAEAASLPLVALTAWQPWSSGQTSSPARRCSSTPAPVASAASPPSSPSTLARTSRPLPAEPTPTCSGARRRRPSRLPHAAVPGRLLGYDVVLDSLGEDSLLESLTVLRPGGLVIGIAGPPDPDFASYLGKPVLRPILSLASRKVRHTAKKLGVRYSFLFMRASGQQLTQITELVEAGVLRTHIEQTFEFDSASGALELIDSGKAKGKVVITMPPAPGTPTTPDTANAMATTEMR